MAERAYIALGSNMGERLQHLQFAIAKLRWIACDREIECSSVYETDPVGPGVQENYYNAVVSLRTELAPEPLLAHCLEIEKQRGRQRLERWGPRTLDLDLLAYGECTLQTSALILPHPRIAERPFVLRPLCDLTPHLRIAGATVADHLATHGKIDGTIRKLGDVSLINPESGEDLGHIEG